MHEGSRLNEEVEIIVWKIVVRAKGLLAMKAAFVTVMSVLYVIYSFFILKIPATQSFNVYILCIIVFMMVFFACLNRTIALTEKRKG